MYNIAEDLATFRYFEKNNDSVTAYLHESFIDGYTGYSIQLTIMKNNIIVDELDDELPNPQEMFINNAKIIYSINRQESKAQFEYQDYKYYLRFDDAIDVEFLTEIITNMFETQATA